MPQILSYFYSQPLSIGTVVEIDVNHRKIKGIVVGNGSIKNRKLDFKKMANFELKKISNVINPESIVSQVQLEVAKWLSEYYYAPLGLCLKTVLPPFFGKRGYDYPLSPSKNEKNSKQTFLMVAENVAGEYFMEKYAGQNPVYVSSGLSNKKYFELWQKVISGEAKYIIGTRIGLFLPFKNLGSIIIDDESNEAYKSDMTPRYHAVELAGQIALIHNAKITINAAFPRIETIYNLKIKLPDIDPKKIELINMVDEVKAANFSIFSRELKDELKTLGGKMILYVPRRGHANYIFCESCGNTIKCPNCNVSLVLHKKITLGKPTESLICHHCQTIDDMPKTCPICGGYRLKPRGIGIEKVEEELMKFYKITGIKAPEILRMDSDIIESEEQEKKIIERFKLGSPVILLTTQLLFSYKHFISDLIPKPITGIISADSLINIPDFRSEEFLFRQLVLLHSLSEKLVVQTYNPTDPAMSFFSKGDVSGFIKQESENRMQFHYPPFSGLTKLTFRHPDEIQARRESFIVAEKIRQIIKQNKIDIEIIGPTPGFISKEKNLFIWNILLKDEKREIKIRNELLRMVSGKSWIIDVEPKAAI